MEQNNLTQLMLSMMDQPAFSAKDGLVLYANPAASHLAITAGAPVASLLKTGQEEYATLESGCLHLHLHVQEQCYGACVVKAGDETVFVLDREEFSHALQALALAAKDLREPLGNLIIAADRMYKHNLHAQAQPDAALFNRSMHQLLRRIGNMSDAAGFAVTCRMEMTDATAFLQELCEKASTLCAQSGVTLTLHNLQQPLAMLMDREKIERAVYNVVSNAIKHTPKGGTIDIHVSRHSSKLHISFTDSGSGIANGMLGSVYNQYLRQPSLEDSSHGIGLGMVIIRAAALAHGGTALIEQLPTGTKLTMTLAIRQKSSRFRSPIIGTDYAGGRDHGLLELADILPTSLYDKNDIT